MCFLLSLFADHGLATHLWKWQYIMAQPSQAKLCIPIRLSERLFSLTFKDALAYLGHILAISWAYLRHILGISHAYLGHILGIYWAYLVHILGISWTYLWHILAISWAYLGHILAISWPLFGIILGIFWTYLGVVLRIYFCSPNASSLSILDNYTLADSSRSNFCRTPEKG